jgi:hypothetical protein
MSSCVASCFISCHAASCAFATSAFSPTDAERNFFHFVSVSSSHLMSRQHQRPSRLRSPRLRSGTVLSVAESCSSSNASLRRNCSSDLRRLPCSAQHESTLPASNHLRPSARTLPPCLASLRNATSLFNPDFGSHSPRRSTALPHKPTATHCGQQQS